MIKGDLIIYGRGDPSIGFRFSEGNYFKGIEDLGGADRGRWREAGGRRFGRR